MRNNTDMNGLEVRKNKTNNRKKVDCWKVRGGGKVRKGKHEKFEIASKSMGPTFAEVGKKRNKELLDKSAEKARKQRVSNRWEKLVDSRRPIYNGTNWIEAAVWERRVEELKRSETNERNRGPKQRRDRIKSDSGGHRVINSSKWEKSSR